MYAVNAKVTLVYLNSTIVVLLKCKQMLLLYKYIQKQHNLIDCHSLQKCSHVYNHHTALPISIVLYLQNIYFLFLYFIVYLIVSNIYIQTFSLLQLIYAYLQNY